MTWAFYIKLYFQIELPKVPTLGLFANVTKGNPIYKVSNSVVPELLRSLIRTEFIFDIKHYVRSILCEKLININY